MIIQELWNTCNQELWIKAEKGYLKHVSEKNKELEEKLEKITAKEVKNYSTNEFYNFLHDEYFPWKYTAKNRLVSTRNKFEYYESHKEELELIKHVLFSFDVKNTLLGLKIVTQIRGLGCAGASGLLSIIFPENFGTVDQFVAKSLLETAEREKIRSIKPDDISLKYAEMIEQILIEKAKSLNKTNKTTYWTPRKIDKVLWSIGHEIKK